MVPIKLVAGFVPLLPVSSQPEVGADKLEGAHCVPFHCKTWLVAGAVEETACPWIFTTVNAVFPVASPVWVAFGNALVTVKLG